MDLGLLYIHEKIAEVVTGKRGHVIGHNLVTSFIIL